MSNERNGGATSGSKAPIDSSAQKEADAFAAQINATWQKSVEAIIETGRLLIKAKDKLPHGAWLDMFSVTFGRPQMMAGKVGFSVRMAQMLMAIARNPVLSNAKFVSRLPASWGTLYQLTTLPPGELQSLIESNAIHPDLRRSDVRKLGFDLCERVPAALDTLVHFMERWKTDELAEHVEPWLDLSRKDLLPTWITNLCAAVKRIRMKETGQTDEELAEEQTSEAEAARAAENDLLKRRKRRLKTNVLKRRRLTEADRRALAGGDDAQ
jgi:hypothetical protein